MAGPIIRVAFEKGVDSEFDYFVPEQMWPVAVGQRVKAPFGKSNRFEKGFCVASDIKPKDSFAGEGGRKLKSIADVLDKEPLLNCKLIDLGKWISEYYVCPLGQVLAAMVPGAVKSAAGVKLKRMIYLATEAECLIKGEKQKQIIDYLRQKNSFSFESAVETQEILGNVGCKSGPVKQLLQKGIIKEAQKEFLEELPVIPENMMIKTKDVVLNEDQIRVLNHINEKITSEKFSVTVLHGVTDSGKTEVYIKAIETCVRNNKGAIVLLPEIALTAQTVQRFSVRFENIAVMHSGLTASQRNLQWRKIKDGKANVVIGARSAVFAPLANVGLVVVDEEHEPSYKQDTVPRYNGRDVAIKVAQLHNAHCILGSATPSLETLNNCERKEFFSLQRLPKRVMQLPMPQMRLVDMRDEFAGDKGINLISRALAERLWEVLGRKEQAILLLNRRGYSSFIYCPACNHTLHCRNCDVSLTFHKSAPTATMKTITGKHMNYGYALCHYCGSQTLVPEKCPICGKGMAMIGLGSQKLEEELAKRFPQAKVSRIDSDSMASKDYYRMLKDFGDGKIDVLAGTQMLAKGLHFPNVTLVGIISADTSLYVPDFRSNERTFQLITQVAGRAGRSQKMGVVFVQTYLPDQPAIEFAIKNDFEGFVKEELKHRKVCNLPPYWRMAAILMRDTKFEKLELACKMMRQKVDEIISRYGLEINVRGPMPMIISRIQRFHRMQIILQTPKPETFQKIFKALRMAGPVRPAVKVLIDIDPVNLI